MDLDDAPVDGSELFGPAWPGLRAFADMLIAEGELRGLIGPRELPRLWSRHILNSTAIDSYIPERAVVVDVGSGAGLPGIVLAIIRPDLHIHLIEPMERRVEWLTEVSDKLGLERVTIHQSRVEDMHGELSVQVVTSRAVAAMKKLVPMTLPLLKSGGQLVALKGERAGIEIDQADQQLRKFGARWVDVETVPVRGTDEPTTVVVVQKK